MKPVDLIRLALRDAGVNGVGQTPSDEENNDVFLHLNMMLAQWNKRRWLVYHLVDIFKTSTGATSYTIGTGADFDVTRPDRIEAAFSRYLGSTVSNQADIPVTVLQSREDYNRISLKAFVAPSLPTYVFYDAAYPVGTLYWSPSPSSGYCELHVSVKETLTQFPDLVTDINLPNEYLEALLWSLAIRARVMFGLPPDPSIAGLAKAALETIRTANAQIPILQMPVAVLPVRSRFNIYTGGV